MSSTGTNRTPDAREPSARKPAASPALIAERTGTNTYTVSNDRGAELQVGLAGAEGSFSPLELLQAALAGCVALSGDMQFASKLGPDFDAIVTVASEYSATEDRVSALTATVTADMSALDADQAAKLVANAERVIERLCAVKRSLNAGVVANAIVSSPA